MSLRDGSFAEAVSSFDDEIATLYFASFAMTLKMD
jgi:hypothetical protein